MAETNGAIYGIVSEEGNIKVGNDVVLMDHATLTIIAKTITDQYGGYMFCNLDPNKTDYMLFTIDNDGVTPKNALIKDYVQPVTSNNGTVAGNFPGVLEAMAPVMSGIPLRRSGEGGVANGMRLARPSGNCVGSGYELDWNGWQTWTDLTDSPPASACPLPNNNKVRGIKHTAGWSGWKNRPTRAALFGADRGKSFYQPAINTPEGQGYLTILCSHYTDGAAMTYSVCYEMRPDYSGCTQAAAHNADLFYPDNSSYYASDCFFNVCVEANGELRLKWLIDNNGVPNSASKRNVLVTTLTAGKWYFIAVRIGAVTDAIKIDVCDPYAGTIQTFTPGATLESLNKQQNYGSLWGNGTPRRNGFRISGAHNQAVNNTFNTWNSATCWTWQAFGTGNGTSGPWAWWNRVLTDAETQELLRSTYETSISMMPRGMAEVYKYCPSMYIPLDEYPTVLPWQTRKGHGVLFTPMQSALTKEYPAFSLRRRKPVQHGQGWKSAQMSIPHPNNFTVIAFFYQPTANGGGPVFNTIFAETDGNNEPAQNNYLHQLYLSVESGGRPHAYWRNNANGYNDNYPGAASTPLQNVGMHMVAWEFDIYYGLVVKAYVDGALWGTTSVGQQVVDNYRSGIDSQYSCHQHALINCGHPLSGFPHHGQVLRSGIIVTDIATYQGCIGATAIAEIYDAWVLATGNDSHV